MLQKGIKKYLINPILGVLPFALYIILEVYFLPSIQAIITAMAVTICGDLFFRYYLKNKLIGVTFYITGIALVVIALSWVIGGTWITSHLTYLLLGEIAIIFQLMFVRLAKTFIKTRYLRRKNYIDRAIINDFFFTTVILQYLLTAHILLLLTYKQVATRFANPEIDHILYASIPGAIITFMFFYQVFRTKYMVNKLREEDWLPIVKEDGQVIGKVAKTVSQNMKNKFLHPVVRVAFICDKRLYLQTRSYGRILDGGKLDHPFEKYMLFKHEIHQAVRNNIRQTLGRDIKQEAQYIMKYTFENESTKRLIFLFALEIEDESIILDSQLNGKFWGIKQIDSEFGDGIFSECFELEYEYIKHMLLLKDASGTILGTAQPN